MSPAIGRYKQKTCPTCGTIHKKQGKYCSRSCGNSRQHTQAHKEHLSQKQSQHMNSPAAADQIARGTDQMRLERKKQMNRQDADLQELTVDDLYVPPVVKKPIQDNQFVQDGDLWTEV